MTALEPQVKFVAIFVIWDKLQSFTLFSSVRQRWDEDVASYTECVLNLSKSAYGDKLEVDDTAKEQALAVYKEGLRAQDIKTRAGVDTLKRLPSRTTCAGEGSVAPRT